MTQNDIPVVMTFAGNDPTGGAGIQADIEAIASMGCQAAPVITALTVQDTRNVVRFEPVAATLVVEQARAVLDDTMGEADAIMAAQQGHRNYAKRQMTWVRREPDGVWFSSFGDDLATPREAVELIPSQL